MPKHKRPWQRGDGKTIVAEAVQPSIMRIYVRWKYTAELVIEPEDLVFNQALAEELAIDVGDEDSCADLASAELRTLLHLYVVCDVFLDDAAKNAVITEIIRLVHPTDEDCFVESHDRIISDSKEFICYI
ncbi:hypothetical protein LTR56_014720 [Elasticomyces elasticus]|nr:hypothetical protein LTR56_014720 [Elasticomyces elasticus]KAK3645482.1 hypothetical protein LTR22_014744 [Elasticomyces elasticus]KAK4915838.1 hypothetical protein LTR49_016096 [Elasticomyces elasticus]KAK5755566.1 hypothetical protein LTS12_014322 [Elasticomyces elasticus]